VVTGHQAPDPQFPLPCVSRAEVAALTRNTMAMGDSSATFLLYPKLTPVQERAFQLLDVPTAS